MSDNVQDLHNSGNNSTIIKILKKSTEKLSTNKERKKLLCHFFDNIFSTFLFILSTALSQYVPTRSLQSFHNFYSFFVFLKNFPLISIYNFSSALFVFVFFYFNNKTLSSHFFITFFCIFSLIHALYSVLFMSSITHSGNFQWSSWEATFFISNSFYTRFWLIFFFLRFSSGTFTQISFTLFKS